MLSSGVRWMSPHFSSHINIVLSSANPALLLTKSLLFPTMVLDHLPLAHHQPDAISVSALPIHLFCSSPWSSHRSDACQALYSFFFFFSVFLVSGHESWHWIDDLVSSSTLSKCRVKKEPITEQWVYIIIETLVLLGRTYCCWVLLDTPSDRLLLNGICSDSEQFVVQW